MLIRHRGPLWPPPAVVIMGEETLREDIRYRDFGDSEGCGEQRRVHELGSQRESFVVVIRDGTSAVRGTSPQGNVLDLKVGVPAQLDHLTVD